MREGRLVMERTSEELKHVDLEQIYLDYFSARPAAAAVGA
jgi:hypothetical protein